MNLLLMLFLVVVATTAVPMRIRRDYFVSRPTHVSTFPNLYFNGGANAFASASSGFYFPGGASHATAHSSAHASHAASHSASNAVPSNYNNFGLIPNGGYIPIAANVQSAASSGNNFLPNAIYQFPPVPVGSFENGAVFPPQNVPNLNGVFGSNEANFYNGPSTPVSGSSYAPLPKTDANFEAHASASTFSHGQSSKASAFSGNSHAEAAASSSSGATASSQSGSELIF